MQQSSATQSLHLSFWGLRKIVACSHSSSQCLLVSTVFGTVSSLHPTSFLMIFTLVYNTLCSNADYDMYDVALASFKALCNYDVVSLPKIPYSVWNKFTLFTF